MPDTRLRSDALADDALAFLKPLVVGVWGSVAVVALANAYGTALSPYGSSPQAVWPVPASIAFAGDAR